jgi:hypothetical protein
MICAVLSSAAASIAGFKYGSPRWAGGLALVPAACALIAVNLKLEPRANWYRRKEQALRALLDRLRYELPVTPNADQIALIAREKNVLDQKFLKDFEKTCVFAWTNFMHQRKS